MSGIFHAIMSAVAQKVQSGILIFFNKPSTETYGYFDGELKVGSSLPAEYQVIGITRIRVGTNKVDPLLNLSSVDSRRGWEGEIGDIRITKGIRPEFADTPVSKDQLVNDGANTISLFRVANVNGTLVWGDIISGTYVPLTPANVFSVSTYSSLFGGNPVLKVKNLNTNYDVGPTHDGLVNTITSNVWCTWPITIDYWARATSNITMKPFVFDNQDSLNPRGLIWQHSANDGTILPARASRLYTGTAAYTLTYAQPAPNVWTKFAIILKP